MATWIQIPGGKSVNADNIQSVEVQNAVLILRTIDGQQISTPYTSSKNAYAAKVSIESSLLGTSGSPTIVSISPSSLAANNDATLVITGTAFRTTALITIGGVATPTSFVSTTTLQSAWFGFSLAAGAYDVVYSDGSGGTNTLVAGFTVT